MSGHLFNVFRSAWPDRAVKVGQIVMDLYAAPLVGVGYPACHFAYIAERLDDEGRRVTRGVILYTNPAYFLLRAD